MLFGVDADVDADVADMVTPHAAAAAAGVYPERGYKGRS